METHERPPNVFRADVIAGVNVALLARSLSMGRFARALSYLKESRRARARALHTSAGAPWEREHPGVVAAGEPARRRPSINRTRLKGVCNALHPVENPYMAPGSLWSPSSEREAAIVARGAGEANR